MTTDDLRSLGALFDRLRAVLKEDRTLKANVVNPLCLPHLTTSWQASSCSPLMRLSKTSGYIPKAPSTIALCQPGISPSLFSKHSAAFAASNTAITFDSAVSVG